jgi:hypothetical protein
MTNPSIYASKLSKRLRRMLAELQALPESELDPIAQEMGLSKRDLSSLACSHPGPSELMPQRLAKLGLDPAYVELAHRVTHQDLQRVCASCKAWRRCARDLANGDVETGMRSYCLNAPTIDALIVDWDTPKH